MARRILVQKALVLWWCLAMGASCWAQQPVDIYRVEVPVDSQSDADREAAAKATLGEVLVRVTGDTSVLLHPMIRDAINDAPDYLAKYTYSSEKNLVLNYSPQAIKTLLQNAQVFASNIGQLQVKVIGVKDFAAFKQVQAYLKSLAVVRKAELEIVSNDTLLFNLTVDGDADLFKTTLAVSNRLQPVDDTGSPLSFRWQD